MQFILVDTADSRGSVALCQNAEILCIEAHLGEEDYSSWLLSAASRVLSQSSLILSELDGYAVCAGPGSFTGLRVGLTTVKAWAEIYGRPIASISRLEALSALHAPMEENFVSTYIDARRDQVFAALYKRSASGFRLLGDESVTDLAKLMARVMAEATTQPVRWISPDAELIESLPQWADFSASRHKLQRVPPPFAKQLGQLAYRKFREGETTEAISLDANYVRRSDAEILWRGNSSAVKA